MEIYKYILYITLELTEQKLAQALILKAGIVALPSYSKRQKLSYLTFE